MATSATGTASHVAARIGEHGHVRFSSSSVWLQGARQSGGSAYRVSGLRSLRVRGRDEARQALRLLISATNARSSSASEACGAPSSRRRPGKPSDSLLENSAPGASALGAPFPITDPAGDRVTSPVLSATKQRSRLLPVFRCVTASDAVGSGVGGSFRLSQCFLNTNSPFTKHNGRFSCSKIAFIPAGIA